MRTIPSTRASGMRPDRILTRVRGARAHGSMVLESEYKYTVKMLDGAKKKS